MVDTRRAVNEHEEEGIRLGRVSRMKMKVFGLVLAVFLCSASLQLSPKSALAFQTNAPAPIAWPEGLPVYDHIVIVIEENKDYRQIINDPAAPYINGTLRAQGASFTRMYAEEHHSEGDYFWLFSGSNQNAGFTDRVPTKCSTTSSLGEQLIRAGRSFKGYSEDLPAIGFVESSKGNYARKHVPWITFCNLPSGKTVADSSNLRFKEDFPSDYNSLPTVSFVIPNLVNDMHNGSAPFSIAAGDLWLREHLDGYYNWAKEHNSLLILTFDESGDAPLLGGSTNPADQNPDKRNQIATIFAGAHIKPGEYAEGKGINHVNILRTLEAMYKLNKSGAQPAQALKAGIADDFVITDVFEVAP
ncbi:MAG: alkaline phosphatase family protein [Terriglobales bacterium]|jgi:acid phosphatase